MRRGRGVTDGAARAPTTPQDAAASDHSFTTMICFLEKTHTSHSLRHSWHDTATRSSPARGPRPFRSHAPQRFIFKSTSSASCPPATGPHASGRIPRRIPHSPPHARHVRRGDLAALLRRVRLARAHFNHRSPGRFSKTESRPCELPRAATGPHAGGGLRVAHRIRCAIRSTTRRGPSGHPATRPPRPTGSFSITHPLIGERASSKENLGRELPATGPHASGRPPRRI